MKASRVQLGATAPFASEDQAERLVLAEVALRLGTCPPHIAVNGDRLQQKVGLVCKNCEAMCDFIEMRPPTDRPPPVLWAHFTHNAELLARFVRDHEHCQLTPEAGIIDVFRLASRLSQSLEPGVEDVYKQEWARAAVDELERAIAALREAERRTFGGGG